MKIPVRFLKSLKQRTRDGCPFTVLDINVTDKDKEYIFREIWEYFGDEIIIKWLEGVGYKVISPEPIGK